MNRSGSIKTKSGIRIFIIFLSLVLLLFFGVFFFSATPYTPKEALNLSEEFIQWMQSSAFEEGYALVSEHSKWNTPEEIGNDWLSYFPEEYTFYSDKTLQSGRFYPYQSIGNYYKRRLLNRKPAGQEQIHIQFFLESPSGELHSLVINVQQEKNQWKILSFEKTAG